MLKTFHFGQAQLQPCRSIKGNLGRYIIGICKATCAVRVALSTSPAKTNGVLSWCFRGENSNLTGEFFCHSQSSFKMKKIILLPVFVFGFILSQAQKIDFDKKFK